MTSAPVPVVAWNHILIPATLLSHFVETELAISKGLSPHWIHMAKMRGSLSLNPASRPPATLQKVWGDPEGHRGRHPEQRAVRPDPVVEDHVERDGRAKVAKPLREPERLPCEASDLLAHRRVVAFDESGQSMSVRVARPAQGGDFRLEARPAGPAACPCAPNRSASVQPGGDTLEACRRQNPRRPRARVPVTGHPRAFYGLIGRRSVRFGSAASDAAPPPST